MHTADDIPGFSGADRPGVTLFASLLLHVVLALGVTFTLPKLAPQKETPPTLDITLVQSRSDKAPDKADFLAQANQRGGGDSDKPTIAKSPVPVQEVTENMPKVPVARPKPQPPTVQTHNQRDILTAKPKLDQPVAKPKPTKSRPPTPNTPRNLGLNLPDPWQQERARLSAEINQSWEAYQKRPRQTFLTARTREYKYAAYMDAWRAKVEQVGNLNYPEEAKRRGLTGSLVLDVALNPDGSINNITVQRSSGHQVLDDAAVRIVKLAAPFAPFPDNIRKDTDILHITRTWEFLHGATLTSR
jgi:protein TonB